MGGQIVDATVIQARPARLTADEKAMVRRGEEPEGWTPARKAQIDRDARWTLKRGRKRPPAEGSKRQAVAIAVPVFGYTSHLGIDRAHGLIRTWTVTHAAAHDGGQLGCLLDPANTASGASAGLRQPPCGTDDRLRRSWADTAYRWRLIWNRWRAMGASVTCSARSRGRPMSRHVARGNATWGEAKGWHELGRAVRRGLQNMRTQAFLTTAAINLKRLAAALADLLAILPKLLVRIAAQSVVPVAVHRAHASASQG